MQAMGLAVKTCSAICSMAPHSQVDKKQDPIVHGQMESHNTYLQAIDLKKSCSGQAQFNRPAIGNGYKSTKPECIHTIL